MGKKSTKKEVKKGESWRKGYQAGFAEAMKACGNCVKCYGKGYGTQTMYATGGGITTKQPIIVFCDCERAKQLRDRIRGIINEN